MQPQNKDTADKTATVKETEVTEIRNEEGITQEELAKMSDISRVALSAIENGTVPNGNTMLNIAKALNTSIENINVKATTEEGLGFTGAKEGIAAQSICLLVKVDK